MHGTRISSLLGKITIVVLICICSLSAEGKYGGGAGEPNDPYLIFDANQMQAIGADSNDWDKHFKLMADIDLSGFTGTSFNIIGYLVILFDYKPFTGVFDGNDHTISNFTYSSTRTDYIGLFGYVSGIIKNLGLIDPNVDAGTGSCVGSLVGINSGTITNYYAQGGCVAGESDVGGLVGRFYLGSEIINSYAAGKVEAITDGVADANTGGFAGYRAHPITMATNSFWDTETSGQINGVGSGDPNGVYGRTTTEMMQQATFDPPWDFVNTWGIIEGQTYPLLRSIKFCAQTSYPVGDYNKDCRVNFLDFATLASSWLEDKNW